MYAHFILLPLLSLLSYVYSYEISDCDPSYRKVLQSEVNEALVSTPPGGDILLPRTAYVLSRDVCCLEFRCWKQIKAADSDLTPAQPCKEAITVWRNLEMLNYYDFAPLETAPNQVIV